MADKKYYTLDREKKIVVVDTTVEPKKGEMEAVELYLKAGYDLRVKSTARRDKMRANADGLDAKTIKEALKDDAEALAKFNNIMEGKEAGYKKGFFAAKKWYKTEYKKSSKK